LVTAFLSLNKDGRSNRDSYSTRCTINHTAFKTAHKFRHHDGIRNQNTSGWFKTKLFMSPETFDYIVDVVLEHWNEHHKPLHHNAIYDIPFRVAITLMYCMSFGGHREVSQAMGCSKKSSVIFFGEVIDILYSTRRQFIKIPKDAIGMVC